MTPTIMDLFPPAGEELESDTQSRTYRVAHDIAPEKSVAKGKRTGSRGANGVDPRRVIQLTHFDRIRDEQRGETHAPRRPTDDDDTIAMNAITVQRACRPRTRR
jgi:hypothetical protein